ncbi:MAG: TraB/GumN family protein [Steroidobacteraceae bacterium]
MLVVVGAMHLVGERGLPALLEERGFRVEEL